MNKNVYAKIDELIEAMYVTLDAEDGEDEIGVTEQRQFLYDAYMRKLTQKLDVEIREEFSLDEIEISV